jgi:hypothetical protein
VILKAIQKNLLKFETPITDFIYKSVLGKANLKFFDARWWDLTISDLLFHTSGIPDFINEIYGFDGSGEYTAFDVLKELTKYQLHKINDGERLYSNSNYFILTLVLDKIYGSWETAVSLELKENHKMKTVSIGNENSRKFIQEEDGLFIANKWNKVNMRGLLSCSIEDLHFFCTSLNSFESQYFTPEYNTFKHPKLYKNLSVIIGASDTGSICIHAFDIFTKFSAVYYTNVFDDSKIMESIENFGISIDITRKN